MLALKEAGIGLPDPDVRILLPRHPNQWRAALGVEEIKIPSKHPL